MNTYYMRHVAPWRYGIIFFLTIFGSTGIGYLMKQKGAMPDSELLMFGLIGGLFWLGLYLARRTAVVDVAITVDDAGVGQTWGQHVMFSNKPDVFIRWEDMAEYVNETGGRTYWVFKIRLKDGTTWRLRRYLTFKKDGFELFLADFSARVEQFNEANKANGVLILEGKTSWERMPALVVAILFVIAMVALPIVMMVRPDMVGLGALGIGYPGALILVIAVYIHRKRRREYEQRLSQGLSDAFHEK